MAQGIRPAPVASRSLAMLLLVITILAPSGFAQSCFGKFNGQGVITTPNFYANNYPWGALSVGGGGRRCEWTLTPAAGKLGNILFNVFDLEAGATLSIFQGTNTAAGAMPLTQYTGKGPVGGVVQVSGVVTLVFIDADLSLSRGFQLAFFSTAAPTARSNLDRPSPECGGVLVGSGTVASPGQPGFYPINSKCLWTLTSCEPGAQITVHFTAMDLEMGDTVTLTSGQTQLGQYSGSTLPKDVTALSPITVAFSSDNFLSSSTGFALQFSTVSTAVTPGDPLANPTACDSLCPVTAVSDQSLFCSAQDDPHMNRFDGLRYEFQKPGLYYMYKHKTAPVSVQAAFQQCLTWSNAFCLCAVAVRYCDEVFVVDKCFNAKKQYKAGTGSAMNIQTEPQGAGWSVTLPTGLRVIIGATTQWIGHLYIYDSVVNRGASEGLCTDAYRCGTSPAQYQRSYDSWWVPPEESLFTVWKPAIPCKTSKCGGVCPMLATYPIPIGVVSLSDPNISEDQYSGLTNARFGTSGASGATGSPPARFIAPWTPHSAFSFCLSSLQWTPVMQQCQQLLRRPVNLEASIANCVRDIQLTGTTHFLTTAKEASKATCCQALKDAGIPPKDCPSMCPNDCSQKGSCINSRCSCVAGRYGLDCSVDISVPPGLTNTSAAVNCTANATVSGVCLLQYVYGQTFYDLKPGYPTCKIAYQADVGGTPTSFNITVVTATYLSPTVVVCKLPPGKPGEHVTYAISISNDGVTYSNNVTAQRTFLPVCGQTIFSSGTLLSPNYPSSYVNNALCVWSLIASAGASVRLTFNAFNVENSFDALRCFDNGQLIDTFTGNLGTSLTPKYYGSSLTCIFTSDQTTTASGFSISFSSVVPAASCGGSIVGSATISSPGYATPGYPNNVYCLWTLTASAGKVLKLHFNAFNLELNYDYLKVYTGGAQVASLTGSALPVDSTLQSTAYLVFRSDPSVAASGFSVVVSSV